MGGGARVPDPGEAFDDSVVVRWEPPEGPDEDLDVDLPAFVPSQLAPRQPAASVSGVPERFEPGADPDWRPEPGADPDWRFEPASQPPPPPPKGQWWAAWLADPTQRHEFRYWDGTIWTEHVSDAGLAGIDAL